jgi:transcriptional regulator with XRE-family HTH domain
LTIENVKALLGRAVKEHRERREMTQETLAERAGVDKQAISLIERGLTWPQYPTLQRVAEALDVLETDLFSIPPREPTPSEALAVITRVIKAQEIGRFAETLDDALKGAHPAAAAAAREGHAIGTEEQHLVRKAAKKPRKVTNRTK